MMRRLVSGLMVALLLTSMLMLTFNIQSAKGEWTGTAYIRADGSIDPPDTPIITFDNITYTLTGDISSVVRGIVIERNNIVIDGAGHTIQGLFAISLVNRENVTIKNLNVKNSRCGIFIYKSSNIFIFRNEIADNHEGIYLYLSSKNCIYGNNITNNWYNGIKLAHSSYNTISENNIKDNNAGIVLINASCNIFNNNNIVKNNYGIYLFKWAVRYVIDINNDNLPEKFPGLPNPVYPNPCGNADFRRALWHTIDREYIIANFWNGSALPLYTHVDPSLSEFIHPDILPEGKLENLTYPYNLTEAARILDEAGFIDVDGDGWRNFPENIGGDGRNVMLKYVIASVRPYYRALGLWHASQLESIGIKVERFFVNGTTWRQEVLTNMNFSLSIIGWYSPEDIFPTYLSGYHSRAYGIGLVNYNRINCSLYDYWVDKMSEALKAKNFEEMLYAALRAQEVFNSQNCLGAIPICASYEYAEGNNSFSQNLLSYNRFGFKLVHSLGNHIYRNDLTNNLYGILSNDASNNKIFHNDFINNTKQVHDVAWNFSRFPFSINIWDNDYPSGGNYWAEYSVFDVDQDGIGDIPYVIDENNVDRYPLMAPFGGLTMMGQNVTSYPSSDVCLIFENVTSEGFTTVNVTSVGPHPPSGFKLAGNYYDIKTTANYTGTIIIRIVYDDSNMTVEEENSLRLMQWDETLQQWTDITTSLDTENNVIYGQTSHLSIFALVTPLYAPPTTYKLTIAATAGGTTNPIPGTYTHTAGSSVQVTAIPSSGYVFDHWELNGTNVGSANPYTVVMNNNHNLKAFFVLAPPPLIVSISPPSASMIVGQSVTFTPTVSGGTPPYTYQWYLNDNPVSGAASPTWTFTPTTSGIFYVYLKVTDSKGNTAQSDVARITVATVPVGGYSIPINIRVEKAPITPYIMVFAILTIALTLMKRKTTKK